MNPELLPLLTRLARLGKRDRQWILDRIHQPARPETALPDFCEGLSRMPPRLVAAILLEGGFPFTSAFLARYDQAGDIAAAMSAEAPHITPATRRIVLQAWQSGQGECHG